MSGPQPGESRLVRSLRKEIGEKNTLIEDFQRDAAKHEREYSRFMSMTDFFEKELTQAQDQRDDLKTRVAGLQEEVDRLKPLNMGLVKQVAGLRADKAALQVAKEDLGAEKRGLEERIATERKKHGHEGAQHHNTIQNLEAGVKSANEKVWELEKRNGQLARENEALQAAAKEADEAYAKSLQELERMKGESREKLAPKSFAAVAAVAGDESGNRSTSTKAGAKDRQAQEQVNELTKQLAAANRRHAAFETEKKRLSKQLASAKQSHLAVRDENSSLVRKVEEQKVAVNEAREQLRRQKALDASVVEQLQQQVNQSATKTASLQRKIYDLEKEITLARMEAKKQASDHETVLSEAEARHQVTRTRLEELLLELQNLHQARSLPSEREEDQQSSTLSVGTHSDGEEPEGPTPSRPAPQAVTEQSPTSKCRPPPSQEPHKRPTSSSRLPPSSAPQRNQTPGSPMPASSAPQQNSTLSSRTPPSSAPQQSLKLGSPKQSTSNSRTPPVPPRATTTSAVDESVQGPIASVENGVATDTARTRPRSPFRESRTRRRGLSDPTHGVDPAANKERVAALEHDLEYVSELTMEIFDRERDERVFLETMVKGHDEYLETIKSTMEALTHRVNVMEAKDANKTDQAKRTSQKGYYGGRGNRGAWARGKPKETQEPPTI